MSESKFEFIEIFKWLNPSPFFMVLISFVFGYIVLFMPWIYVTAQAEPETSDEENRIVYLRSYQEFPSINNCVVTQVYWNSSLLRRVFEVGKFFSYILRLVPIYLWLFYLGRYVKKTRISLTLFFLGSLFFITAPVIIFQQVLPDEVFCDPVPIIQIINISIFLPTILLWILSVGFGILSLKRGDTML